MTLVPRPAIVAEYNASMGGVDLFNMFQSLYRMEHKSKRWCMQIFYWMISASAINGWVPYRKDADAIGVARRDQKTLGQFTSSVSNSLVVNAKPEVKKSRGRPRLDDSIQSDEVPVS